MGLPPTSNLRKKTTGFSRETMHLLNFLPHFHFPLFLFPCSEVFAFPQALFFFFPRECAQRHQFIPQVVALLSLPGRSKAGFFTVGEKQCFLGDSLHMGLSPKCAGVYMSLGSFYEDLVTYNMNRAELWLPACLSLSSNTVKAPCRLRKQCLNYHIPSMERLLNENSWINEKVNKQHSYFQYHQYLDGYWLKWINIG